MELTAIHECHVGEDVVAPGKDFECEDEDIIAELLKAGAAKTKEAELAGVVEADGTVVELEEMKVADLKDLAKEMEIKGYADMKKAELVEAIKAEQVEI